MVDYTIKTYKKTIFIHNIKCKSNNEFLEYEQKSVFD